MNRYSLIETMAHAFCQSFYGSEWSDTSEFRQNICMVMAHAALDAIEDVAVIVPRGPTDEMLDALAKLRPSGCSLKQAYAAMLAASPYGREG